MESLRQCQGASQSFWDAGLQLCVPDGDRYNCRCRVQHYFVTAQGEDILPRVAAQLQGLLAASLERKREKNSSKVLD